MNTQNDFLDNLVDDEFDVDSAGDLNAEMCSSLQGDTEKMCSSLRGDTCGDGMQTVDICQNSLHLCDTNCVSGETDLL